jgi:hypothetical protein
VKIMRYEFDRYINGQLMAEGVTIEKAETLEAAMAAAVRIAPKGPNGEAPVLVLRREREPVEPVTPPDALALVAAAYRDAVRKIQGVTIIVAPDGISHREGAESVRRQLAGFIATLTPADAQAALAAIERAAYERGVREALGNLPPGFATLVGKSMAEAQRAMRKFPQPNYVISKFAEEAGEVVKAAIHHAENRETRDAVVGEMRQVLAMMLRLWIEGDQVHGMNPLMQDAGGPGK